MKKKIHYILIIFFITACGKTIEESNDSLIESNNCGVNLPDGEGRIIQLDKGTVYKTFCLKKINDDSVQFYADDTLCSLSEFSLNFDESLLFTKSLLFIDQNIELKKIEELFRTLRGFCLNSIIIFVENKHDKENLRGIETFLPYAEKFLFNGSSKSELPPPPPIIDITSIEVKNNVFYFKNNQLFLDSTRVSDSNFRQIFNRELTENFKKIWTFHLDSSSSFQNLIKFYDLCYTEYYKKRDMKALELYGSDFNSLEDSLQRQIRKAVPIRVYRVSDHEFSKMVQIVDINTIIE